ncbi:MAG: hypothetical protein DELT_02740 [Desulfovibrio sp.]
MFFSPQRLPISWLCVCIALIGAAFCAMQALPAQTFGQFAAPVEIPCPGSGCTLFQDFTVYGISLWWAGVAFFLIELVLCLKKAHSMALFTATAALVADGVLLVIMLVTAACVACLGAAALMGIFFLAIRRHVTAKLMPAPGPSFVLLAWAGLFIAAVASAGTSLAEPWTIAGEGNMERRVYFSPSCPACRDALVVFAGKAAFIPVAERDTDYAAIRVMRDEIANGKTLVEALHASDTASESAKKAPFSLGEAFWRLRLLRNKAEALNLGADRLPLIIINGMPENLRPGNNRASAAYSTGNADSSALPPELSAIDSCGGTPEPCDPPGISLR